MTSVSTTTTPVPRRPCGLSDKDGNARSLSIVGLGCSSFSTFFWTDEEANAIDQSSSSSFDAQDLQRSHPKVQEWIHTIRHAVVECGINLLDTAPWYGHGTSEIVIGWAMEELLQPQTEDRTTKPLIQRDELIINTKVARYEADPERQFDFSATTTQKSVERSIKRMKCTYIDVLQLHDPEFAPDLDQLLNETIPTMIECRKRGLCKAIGMTGYPLRVQYQILQASMDKFGNNIWDQALTYGHFNLHDSSLFNQPILSSPSPSSQSFAEYCQQHNIALLAAAPLSMGLLTNRHPPPAWHPAGTQLRQACQDAAVICRQKFGVDIAIIAILYALSHPTIPCTILGMKSSDEVNFAVTLANRFQNVMSKPPVTDSPSSLKEQHDSLLKQVLTDKEREAYDVLSDPLDGPFASIWKKDSDDYQWDGVEEAYKFWRSFADGPKWEQWQLR